MTARPFRSRSRTTDRGGRFLVPLVVVMGLTSLFPTLYSIYMSVFDWNWGQRFNFVGFDNYVSLAGDERFRTALINTFVFTISAVGVEFLIGLGLALVVHRIRRGVSVFRTLLLVPLMVSGIIVSVIWKIMLDPTLGILNYVLQAIGFAPVGFFGDPGLALASVVLVDLWWQSAFVFIVLLAGLGSLPQEPLEAAEVDGAGTLQRLWFVTLPLLRPVILVVLLFRTIDCLKVFAIIFGTTGGGPLGTTESVQVLAYRVAFKQLNMSQSMTMMVIFSVIVLAIVLLYQRFGSAAGADA